MWSEIRFPTLKGVTGLSTRDMIALCLLLAEMNRNGWHEASLSGCFELADKFLERTKR